MFTLDFLDKKHVKFDQGLDFLIFYKGNRGQIEEKRSKVEELSQHRAPTANIIFAVRVDVG